jgi:hypothetical protein
MVDVFHQEKHAPIEIAQVPDAPKPVSSDWSPTDPAGTARTLAGKVREERRASIERAVRGETRERSPSGQFQTKQERYDRQVGSEREKASTRGSVRAAAEKVGHVPTRDENVSSRAELRKAVQTLEQRYPGRRASDFIKTAKEWEAAYKVDPVGTREKILEQYAKVSPENFRDVKEPEKARGARGSVRQAMRDHEIMADLAAFEKEFGSKLPGVLSELVRHDAALVNDPVGTSARLAASYGAPTTPAQQAQYEQRQHQERARAQDSANMNRAFDIIIQHKVLPGFETEAMQHAIADVLTSKGFQRTGDRLEDLKRAHAQVMASKTVADRAAGRGNRHFAAGQKSIHGAPSAAQDSTRSSIRPAAGVRAAINRARGRA